MIITSLSNSTALAKKLATKLKAKYTATTVKSFPDGDLYLRYNTTVAKQTLIIVESFQPNPNQSLLNIIFAAKTAKDLKAKKVILISPYLAFMRQDKRFNSGEAINAPIMGELLSNAGIDLFLTVDPHLHRIHELKEIIKTPAKNLTANKAIADYIAKNYAKEKDNLAIIGPDSESYQWAEEIAKQAGLKNTILSKTRHSSRKVDVKIKKQLDMKGKHIIIIDDIISTGNTMIKAAQKAKKEGASKITAIGVHGLFVESALLKMAKIFDNIHTVNTIEHPTNAIDISSVLVDELKKRKIK